MCWVWEVDTSKSIHQILSKLELLIQKILLQTEKKLCRCQELPFGLWWDIAHQPHLCVIFCGYLECYSTPHPATSRNGRTHPLCSSSSALGAFHSQAIMEEWIPLHVAASNEIVTCYHFRFSITVRTDIALLVGRAIFSSVPPSVKIPPPRYINWSNLRG